MFGAVNDLINAHFQINASYLIYIYLATAKSEALIDKFIT